MKVFQLNQDGTLHSVVDADESPLEPGVFLVPAGAIDVPLPQEATTEGHVWVWSEDAGWAAVADHRGATYWLDGVEHRQAGLGPLPDGASLTAPPPGDSELLAQIQAQAQSELNATDMVALRCFKSGVSFPAAWLSYVHTLRLIVAETAWRSSLELPTRPSYPSGT